MTSSDDLARTSNIDDRGRRGEHKPSPKHRLCAHMDAFNDNATRTYKAAVFNNHRSSSGWLKNASDTDPSAEVNISADLGT